MYGLPADARQPSAQATGPVSNVSLRLRVKIFKCSEQLRPEAINQQAPGAGPFTREGASPPT